MEAKEQADGFGSGAFSAAGAATRAAFSADVIVRAATVGHGRSGSMASKQGRDRERSNSPSADSPAHRHAAHSRHSSTRSGGGGGGGAFQFEREQAFNVHRRFRTAADGSQREWASSTGGIGSSTLGLSGPSRSVSHVPVTVPRTVLEPHLLDLGRLGPGWFFGELGVLRSEARSASVYAESSCELLVLSRSDVFGRLPAECLRFLEEYAAHFYAPTAELKQQFKQQRRWEQFKQRMRQQSRRAPSLAESVAGFSGSLQDLKH